MKHATILLTGIAAAGNLIFAGEPQLLNDAYLARLRAESATSHPTAVAGRQKALAADRETSAVRLWNDPMVGMGFMVAEEMMRADEGDIMLGIEQELPKPGVFAAERMRAESMHRATVEDARASGLAAGAEAARAAIELALADESLALQQAQTDWLSSMAENARQMAAGPMASGTDALRMETELARERQMLDSLRRTREGLAGKLNLVLGRPVESPWPPLRLPAKPPPVPVAQAEIARIPHVNPKVRAMIEMAGAAAAETQVAGRERAPSVSVGADARLYSGNGDLRSTTVGIKLTLPWFNDPVYQGKIGAAKAREAAAGHEVEAMRREIAAMVLTSATDAANAAAQARALSGEIHDKASAARKSVEAAWISSKAPLTDLLDASRTLFSIKLEQRRMTAMELAALEELRTLVPNR